MEAYFSRDVAARFDGGQVRTGTGALLVRKGEHGKAPEWVRQRVYGLAPGREDLNEHEHEAVQLIKPTACGWCLAGWLSPGALAPWRETNS